jgi:hypothetical protein
MTLDEQIKSIRESISRLEKMANGTHSDPNTRIQAERLIFEAHEIIGHLKSQAYPPSPRAVAA